MRGKVVWQFFQCVFDRITPAYAGKRECGYYIVLSDRDHPRLCGEKDSAPVILASFGGSPPPMRGKALTYLQKLVGVRITPAYAGKSICKDYCGTTAGDHPRLCGEKFVPVIGISTPIGSPPPMRGKVNVLLQSVVTFGITPAYAGKSQCAFTVCSNFRDHPRLCGEKFRRLRLYQRHQGSPPPMRGKVIWDVEYYECGGITPAYAGKSCRFQKSVPLQLDHPRLCGEKRVRNIVSVHIYGSPPPMRGKGFAEFLREASNRITPAYAGKSDLIAVLCYGYADHPRLCGEKPTDS